MKNDAEDMNKAADEALKIEKDLNLKGDKVSKIVKTIALTILAFISGKILWKKFKDWKDARAKKKAEKDRQLTPEEADKIKKAGIEAERRAAKENPEAYASYSDDEYEPIKD